MKLPTYQGTEQEEAKAKFAAIIKEVGGRYAAATAARVPRLRLLVTLVQPRLHARTCTL